MQRLCSASVTLTLSLSDFEPKFIYPLAPASRVPNTTRTSRRSAISFCKILGAEWFKNSLNILAVTLNIQWHKLKLLRHILT